MNKKSHKLSMCCALLLGLPLTSMSVSAQNAGGFDDRWYITAGAGANHQDKDRDTENAAFGTLGVGKFVNPNWSIDAEINYQNPKARRDEDLNFSQYGISLDARRHFRKEGRMINPYIVGGVGYQRAEEEFDAFPNPVSPGQSKRSYATAKLGLGAQVDFSRVKMRGEIAARHSFDNDSVINPGESGFTDTLASLTLLVPLGPERAAVVQDAPIVDTLCSDRDDDGDGVNNCNDKCPNSQAGQIVGPDGCSAPVSIDLRGINFNFDQATLRSDAVLILNEAVEILRRYPELRVEVAGHTDECGTDDYNQGLSERRARAVYDYLTSQGIDSDRLSGPNGYGESRPLENRGDAFPACKSEVNRRTELNVE